MLPDIRPLLTDEISHRTAPPRDIFGQPIVADDDARYLARVIYLTGRSYSPSNHERAADAKAIVWLLNHPERVSIGDVITLPDGAQLAVSSFELRTSGADSLHKVSLT